MADQQKYISTRMQWPGHQSSVTTQEVRGSPTYFISYLFTEAC